MQGESAQVVRFGVFEADLRSGELRKHGIRVKLQTQPFEVLSALLERPNDVVTRQELQARLWPGDTYVDFDRALNKCVNRIRDVLGDCADSPRFVETLPKRGYRWIAPLRPPAADPVSHPPPSEPAKVGPVVALLADPRFGLRKVWSGAAVLALLACGILVFSLRQRNATARMRSIRAIAVLPLENLSKDPAQEPFADGMTDALITILAKTDELRIISLSSCLPYKGSKKPAGEIARELNVDAVLQGSVLQSRDRVRISVRLVRGSPEAHLWSETYERPSGDILALQDAIARSVAGEIRIKLLPAASGRTYPNLTPGAYEAFLQGRFFWDQRTEAGMRKATEFFERSIALDANFAPAYAGLADAYLVRNAGMIPRGLLMKGEIYAQKALELDGTLAAAHASLGRARLFSDWDWSGAEKELKRAIELDPNYAVARQWYGIYLSILGQHQEAMAQYQKSLDLDPLSPTARLHVGLGWYFARQYGRAIQAFEEILVSDPSYVMAYRWLGAACAQDGQFERGLQACRRARELGDNWMSLFSLGYVEAAAGHRRAALLLADELAELSHRTYVSPYLVAAIHARLGDREHAFEWLERAYQEKSSVLPFLEVHGWFDAVREDRRFTDLSRRVGLPGVASSRPPI